MKTIEQLAREAKLPVNHPDWAEAAQRFHDAAIAQYREGLLAGSGEPEWYHAECDDPDYSRFAQDKADAAAIVSDKGGAISALYTADQMAAAVLRERDAMRAELEAANADAARYRAIPELNWYVGPEYNTYNGTIVDEYANYSVTKQELDAAIAAAMKGQPT